MKRNLKHVPILFVLVALAVGAAMLLCPLPASAQIQPAQNQVFDVTELGPHYLIRPAASNTGSTASFAWTFRTTGSEGFYLDWHINSGSIAGPITVTTNAILDPLNVPGGTAQHAGGTATSIPCQYSNQATGMSMSTSAQFTASGVLSGGDIFISCSRSGAVAYVINFSFGSGGGGGANSDVEEVTYLCPPLPSPNVSIDNYGGQFQGAWNYIHITTNTSTQIKTIPGVLHAVIVNNPGSAWTVSIWDNASSCATTEIAATGSLIAGQWTPYDAALVNGLCVTTSGTTPGDLTILYR